jgi:LPS O-antigen subunit length determinant protein (WzzB/FepE family)
MAKDTKNQGFVYDAFDLIQFAWDRKWILIGVSVVAFFAAAIISWFITPRFKSTVTLFPAASVSVSKNLVETAVITSDTKDILTFGEDEEAERLLQILHSDQVRHHIIDKFQLMDHYEIDSNSTKYPYTKLIKNYKSNVKFRRTEFMSIEIEVLDTDAQMAADIANEIASYIDSVFFQIKRARALEAYAIVEREFNTSKAMIEELTDSLSVIRSYGISDYESQSQGLSLAYAEAIGRGDDNARKAIEKKMAVIEKYGGVYNELDYRTKWEIERNSLLKTKMAAAKVNLESTMPNAFIVDKATKSERKHVPKRSIITIISTLSTFALTLLLLLVIDNLKVRS